MQNLGKFLICGCRGIIVSADGSCAIDPGSETGWDKPWVYSALCFFPGLMSTKLTQKDN